MVLNARESVRYTEKGIHRFRIQEYIRLQLHSMPGIQKTRNGGNIRMETGKGDKGIS